MQNTYGYDAGENCSEMRCDYRARYYEPSTGRFFSEDPIRFKADPNFYRYVQNGPVNSADPSGLIKWKCIVWMAGARSFPAVSGIFARCESDCIGGKKLRQTLLGGGGGGAVGSAVGVTNSDYTLEDPYTYINPLSLVGEWAYGGPGIAWGLPGYSYSSLRLGTAISVFSGGWQRGLDYSVSAVGGATVPISTKWEDCSCKAK